MKVNIFIIILKNKRDRVPERETERERDRGIHFFFPLEINFIFVPWKQKSNMEHFALTDLTS